MTENTSPTDWITPDGEKVKLFTNDRYLRGRPFMLLYHSFAPGEGDKVLTKGWINEPSVRRLERVVVVDRVSDKQMQGAAVIVDVLNMKLVKNRAGATDREAMNRVHEEYAQEIAEIAEGWMITRARELAAKGIKPMASSNA